MKLQFREQRVSKSKRIGIIWFVKDFKVFSVQAETIFKKSNRRNDLDKAYKDLVSAIFEHIERIARESAKSPKDVVMMENFHLMHGNRNLE